MIVPTTLSFQNKATVLLGVVVFFTLTHSLAYFNGLASGREELAIYKLTVKAVGEAQEAKTKQVIISQQQLTNEANDEATKLRTALTNYFNDPRVYVDYGSGKRKQSPVPNSPRGANAPASEREVDSVVAKTEECVSVISAAQDAMTILLWQKWAKDNIELRP